MSLISVGANKALQPVRQREFFRVAQIQQRPAEIVPSLHELEQRHRRECRRGERYHDSPEQPPIAQAVDASRLQQLFRNRNEELT